MDSEGLVDSEGLWLQQDQADTRVWNYSLCSPFTLLQCTWWQSLTWFLPINKNAFHCFGHFEQNGFQHIVSLKES